MKSNRGKKINVSTNKKSNRENPYYINKYNSEKSKGSKSKKQILNFSPVEEKFYKRSQEIGMPLIRQYPVSRYKIDFVYIHKDEKDNEKFKIAIEIDGSKYHTTNEQLNSDYKRERYLLLKGFRVVRFTGSEIYNNCSRCIDELLTIINYLNDSVVYNTQSSFNPLVEEGNEKALSIKVRDESDIF